MSIRKRSRSMVEETKRRRPASRFFRFLLPLFLNPPLLSPKSQKTGEHRRRVRPDGPGHEAAPGLHRGGHAEAPGEREREERVLVSLFWLFFLLEQLSLSLSLAFSLTRFLKKNAKQSSYRTNATSPRHQGRT